jgi:hypothetical protein
VVWVAWGRAGWFGSGFTVVGLPDWHRPGPLLHAPAHSPLRANPATLDKIREQQARVGDQYPAHTTAYLSRPAPQNLPVDRLPLVPANKRNGDGTRRFKPGSYGL